MRHLLAMLLIVSTATVAQAQALPSRAADSAGDLLNYSWHMSPFPRQANSNRYESELSRLAQRAAMATAEGSFQFHGIRRIDETYSAMWNADDKEAHARVSVNALQVFTISHDKWMNTHLRPDVGAYFRSNVSNLFWRAVNANWPTFRYGGLSMSWSCYESERSIVMVVAIGNLKDTLDVTMSNPTPYYVYAYDGNARRWLPALAPWELRTVKIRTNGGPAYLWARRHYENGSLVQLGGKEAFMIVGQNNYRRSLY